MKSKKWGKVKSVSNDLSITRLDDGWSDSQSPGLSDTGDYCFGIKKWYFWTAVREWKRRIMKMILSEQSTGSLLIGQHCVLFKGEKEFWNKFDSTFKTQLLID